MRNSGINWTTGTFNAWTGCTKIDQECKNCYAEVLLDQRYGANREKRWGTEAKRKRTSESNWKQVKKWNSDAASSGEPHFVFCGSLMDVMDGHESIPQAWRDDLYKLISETPNLTWLLLTKRPENYVSFLNGRQLSWPHVWLGTTCGHDGDKARGRIEALQGTPIHSEAQRFVSAEPLLSDISGIDLSGIGWVIAGGESGAGARPFDLKNAWNLYEACDRQHIAFWFKQIGEITVDGAESIEKVSSLHDLSQVPSKYAAMIRRERPEPYRASVQAVPTVKADLPALEAATWMDATEGTDSALSEWVDCQFPTDEVKARELVLRPQLLAAVTALKRSRFDTGRLLTEYRKLFKGTFDGLLNALGIKRRTGFDIIEDYERAKAVAEPLRAAASRKGIDLAERKYEDLALQLAKSAKSALSDDEADVEFEAVAEEVKSERLKSKLDKGKADKLVQISLSGGANATELEEKVKSALGADVFRARYIAWLKTQEAALAEAA